MLFGIRETRYWSSGFLCMLRKVRVCPLVAGKVDYAVRSRRQWVASLESDIVSWLKRVFFRRTMMNAQFLTIIDHNL